MYSTYHISLRKGKKHAQKSVFAASYRNALDLIRAEYSGWEVLSIMVGDTGLCIPIGSTML
jgi:hypothetical protein